MLATLSGGLCALAGCSGGKSSVEPTPVADSTPSAFESLEVTADAIVVSLGADHNVTELSLIGPDGRAVTTVDVETGVRTVDVPILELNPERSGYEHYQPGEHELVAVLEDSEVSTTLSLEPDLHVTAIEQYRDGSKTADLGKLAVTVENRGTGPTWVYDIAFEEAPNFAVNDELTTNPGIPKIGSPTTAKEATLEPGQEQTFITDDVPLLLPDSGDRTCGEPIEFIVKIGTPLSEVPLYKTQADTGGEQKSVSFLAGEVCTEVTIEEFSEHSTAE